MFVKELAVKNKSIMDSVWSSYLAECRKSYEMGGFTIIPDRNDVDKKQKTNLWTGGGRRLILSVREQA